MKFTKMHGLGNDYVYLDCMACVPSDLPALAVRLSNRHFGVGADGLICICPSTVADAKMLMFNADGSQGEMCGNGIRCVGKFLYDKGIARRAHLTVETLAGVRTLEVTVQDGVAVLLTVDMGVPEVFENLPLRVEGGRVEVRPVSMGNPHAVLFQRGIDAVDLPVLGRQIECHAAFPNRTNVEFVEVVSAERLRMRVWERGSGETLACGTGACAAWAAAAAAGYTARRGTVELRGGELAIDWRASGRIYLTGPAVTVFEGEMN